MAGSSLKLPLVGMGVVLVAGVAAWLVFDADPGPARPAVPAIAAPSSADAPPAFQAPLGSATTPNAEVLEAAPQHAAPAALAASAPGSGPAAALASQAPAETVEFTGRVVDGSGRPVESAVVTFIGEPIALALRRDRGSDAAEPAAPATSTTDREGRFRLKAALPEAISYGDLPGFPGMEPQLVVRHPQFATLAESLGRLTAGAREVGELSLESGAWIVGRVVDSLQRPVAGARVRARNEERGERGSRGGTFLSGAAESLDAVITGPDGRFDVRGLKAGAASLTAQKSGLRLARKGELTLEARTPLQVGDIQLEAGAAIAGVVVDERGQPLPDAEVSVSSMARIVLNRIEDLPRQQIGEEFGQRARTDAQGRFEVAGLAGGTYTVHVSAPERADLQREDVPAGTRNLTLQPLRLGSLLVTLLDSADGTPVTGAAVRATQARDVTVWGPPSDPLAVLAGAEAVAAAAVNDAPEGSYLVKGAGLDGTQLVIAAEGYATQEVAGPPVASAALGRLTVRLVPAAVVAGRVLDEQQQPIAGAQVQLLADTPDDDDIVSVAGGRAEVRRSVRLGRRSDDPHAAHDTGELSAARLTARTGADGVFEIRGASAGDWKLEARADGFVTSPEQRLTLAEGQSQRDLALVLGRAGVLTGLVTETDGTPAADIEISVTPVSAQAGGSGGDSGEDDVRRRFGRLFGGPRAPGERRARSEPDGSYRIEGLGAGAYTAQLGGGPRRGQNLGGAIVFTMEGNEEAPAGAPSYPVQITAGAESRLDFVRPKRGSVSGRVIAAGAPVPGVSVTMRRSGGLPFGGERATTDERGEFRFEDVEAGSYDVSAMPPGAALEKRVTAGVEAGQAQRADLLFTGSTLAGRVVDSESGAGVEGVQLTVSPVRAGGSGEATPQLAGAFSIAMVTSDGGGRAPGGGMLMSIGGGPASGARTDASGAFELRYLEPGSYSIEASGAGYMRTTEGPLEVSEGQNKRDLELTVQRGAVVEGRVVSGADGQALEKVPVRLQGLDDQQMNVTQAGGRYRFDGLEPGEYTVEVLGSGFMSEAIASEKVTLDVGETRSMDLTTKG